MPELGPTLKVVQTSSFSLPFTLFPLEGIHCAVFNGYLPPLLVFDLMSLKPLVTVIIGVYKIHILYGTKLMQM